MQTTENIVALFLDRAEKQPDQIAIIKKNGAPITYDELRIQIESRAAYLYQEGIRTGDRVLLFIPQGLDLYRNMMALFYLGAIAVVLDTKMDKARMEYCYKQADCKGFIAGPKTRVRAIFSRVLRKIPVKIDSKSKVDPSIFPLVKVHGDHTALISFSQTDDAKPIAAKRSHVFLFEQFQALVNEIAPNAWDISLPMLATDVLVNLGIGATSVMPDVSGQKLSEIEVEKILRQLRIYRVNRLSGSPALLKKLAAYLIERVEELPDVSKVYCSGSWVLPEDARMLREIFPHASIKISYGSEEAEPISIIDAEDLTKEKALARGLCVGQVYKEAEVKLITVIDSPIKVFSKKELRDLQVAPGQIGEIIVRGPHVLPSYFNNFGAFERNKIVAEDELWHRTGDAGFLLQGKLYFTGKCASLIPTKDGFCTPFLYENYVSEIKQVRTGTLVALDKKLTLVLELKKEKDRNLVVQKLTHANLTFDQIIFVKKIPRKTRDATSIDYPQLKKQLAKQHIGSSMGM